jgi:hypothetical protein
VKSRKVALIVLAVLATAIGVGTIMIARHWPFSEAIVKQSLQEDFPATVSFRKFHQTFFPHPGCFGEGVVFRRLGRSQDTPPIVTIQHLTIEAHYVDLLLRPHHLARIVVEGFRVHVAPPGTPLASVSWQETKTATAVGEIIANGASIEIPRTDDHQPLLFEIHTLKLTSVSQSKPMGYEVTLHNPLPPGEISAQGHFGPWKYATPGETPVDGHYAFQNADLSVFDGIAGMLSSEDKFQGVVGHIESQGSIDIPDFMVTRSEHSVHLSANFHAFVDGTNGNVQLERVTAAFLKTRVLARGKVAGQAGQHGKTATIDLNVQNGRIQDVLRLFVRGKKPPLNGVTDFRAHVTIPPGKRPFVEKVQLAGDFGIADGQFAKESTQNEIDSLSERSRGIKPDSQEAEGDSEEIISNVAGHVELREASATFADASFTVPGALARMNGTYNLESQVIDLHGTLKTEAELSQMNSGIKSVLLKPFNVFFKKKHAGAVVPVHLIGTYKHPEAGLDLPAKASPGGAAPAQK